MVRLGHEVKLINPRFVTPYRKGNKNDFNDAEAICEALSRPTMRFVEPKSLSQQDLQSLHRARRLAMSQRNRIANHLRSLLTEYGIVMRRGVSHLRREALALLEQTDRLTAVMRQIVSLSLESLKLLEQQLKHFDRNVQHACQDDERCLRLTALEGVGPLIATASVAKAGNAQQFKSGRQFSAYLGLVPGEHSTGGKTVLLRITKRGDRYLRTLLIHGARAALKAARKRSDPLSCWLNAVAARRGANVAAVALANKNSRRIWKLLSSGAPYLPQPQVERASAAHDLASQKTAGRRRAKRLKLEPEIRNFSAALQP